MMKLCHTEAMKEIKELEERKRNALSQERNRSMVTYSDANKDKIKTNYSYGKTRDEVDKLDAKIRKIRKLLALANCNVIIEEFGMPIGEALVYLAQLQNKLSVVEDLAGKEQIVRSSRYDGTAIFYECNYDVEAVGVDLIKIRAEISRLQIAIDRANLNNYIEI